MSQQPLTTRKELLAWIMYDFSSAIFPTVSMNVFIPLILEQLAYSVGRQPESHLPCFQSTDQNVLSNGFNVTSGNNTTTPVQQSDSCEVSLLGWYVPTVSYVLYITSISVIIQTISFLSFGSLADYGKWRKTLLITCSLLGSMTAILFVAVTQPSLYWLASLLTILGNVFYGLTIIFYNAYLPVLVKHHPFVKGRLEEIVDIEDLEKHLTLLGVQRGLKTIRGVIETRVASSLLFMFSWTNWRKRPQTTKKMFLSPPTDHMKQQQEEDEQRQEEVVEEKEKEEEETVLTEMSDDVAVTEPRFMRHEHISTQPERPSYPKPPLRKVQSLTLHQPLPEAPIDESRSRIKLQTKLQDRIANTLSTHGLAAGQIASLLMIFLSASIIYTRSPNDTYAMQICVCVSGIWWLIFSPFTFLYLKSRPGPPFPKGENWVWYSWRKMIYSIGHYKRLPNTYIYLLAYFIFSDAFTTIGQVAILFARKSIMMSNTQISVALVLAPLSALIGSYFWLWLSKRQQWTTKRTLLVILCISLFLPIYALLGYIPYNHYFVIIDGNPPVALGFGLKTVVEMYLAVVLFSFLLGAINSFGRVLFTDLLPSGHESEFFALYEITDRGTSWIGPLVVGALSSVTDGDLRIGFVYVLVALSVPIVVMGWFLDVPKGRLECEQFCLEEFEKQKRKRGESGEVGVEVQMGDGVGSYTLSREIVEEILE